MSKSTVVKRIRERIKNIRVKYCRLLQRKKRLERHKNFKESGDVGNQLFALRNEEEEYEIALDVVREVSNPARGGQTRRQR